MDWTKTRKAKRRESPFRDTPPIYLRVFSTKRQQDTVIHALLSLIHDPAKLVTIVGSKEYLEEIRVLVDGHKVRLLNLQKALHAKHQGLMLLAEPTGQADMRRMLDLVTQIKPDVVQQKEIT